MGPTGEAKWFIDAGVCVCVWGDTGRCVQMSQQNEARRCTQCWHPQGQTWHGVWSLVPKTQTARLLWNIQRGETVIKCRQRPRGGWLAGCYCCEHTCWRRCRKRRKRKRWKKNFHFREGFHCWCVLLSCIRFTAVTVSLSQRAHCWKYQKQPVVVSATFKRQCFIRGDAGKWAYHFHFMTELLCVCVKKTAWVRHVAEAWKGF